jgi:thioredoxin reductase (NADPH)
MTAPFPRLDGERRHGARRSDRPHLLEASMPGLFAVGDVRAGSITRCAAAVGEGSMSVALVDQRLAAMR